MKGRERNTSFVKAAEQDPREPMARERGLAPTMEGEVPAFADSSVAVEGVKAKGTAWVGEGMSWWTSLAPRAGCLCGHKGNPQRLLLIKSGALREVLYPPRLPPLL